MSYTLAFGTTFTIGKCVRRLLLSYLGLAGLIELALELCEGFCLFFGT